MASIGWWQVVGALIGVALPVLGANGALVRAIENRTNDLSQNLGTRINDVSQKMDAVKADRPILDEDHRLQRPGRGPRRSTGQTSLAAPRRYNREYPCLGL
jgi:hypothetical protein